MPGRNLNPYLINHITYHYSELNVWKISQNDHNKFCLFEWDSHTLLRCLYRSSLWAIVLQTFHHKKFLGQVPPWPKRYFLDRSNVFIQELFVSIERLTIFFRYGVAHDGDIVDYPPGNPGAANCSWNDGYIMSYNFGTPRKMAFSSCFAQQFNFTYKWVEFIFSTFPFNSAQLRPLFRWWQRRVAESLASKPLYPEIGSRLSPTPSPRSAWVYSCLSSPQLLSCPQYLSP